MAARDNERGSAWDRSSYGDEARARFGSGNGIAGFGAGGQGLPYVFLALTALLLLVSCRLAYIQLFQGRELSEKASDRRTNVTVLQARRGTIYDRRGNVLAVSEECYDVYANPREVDDVPAVAALLSQELAGDVATYEEQLSQPTTFVYLKRKADKTACEDLRSELAKNEHTGVYLIRQTRRSYPYGAVAGQILGMVNVDNEGVTGLELAYDEQLRGEDGKMVMETGLGGVPIAGAVAELTDPVDGRDLVLSIDIDVQRFMEDQVSAAVVENEAKSGFAMATDPRTGEILAACSTPFADLTHPENLVNEALNLKLVSDSYDPGSIFKVLTAAIGLESGTVDTSTYYSVPPTILVGQDVVADEDGRWEYTDMNLREVLRRSSNVGAALIAQESIGADAFAQGLEDFGIGSRTGIDYPGEVEGIVKGRAEYDGSSVGSMSFGQGLSIPMVQMVRAVGAIANGGKLYSPHFATALDGKPQVWESQGQAVSGAVAYKVTDMMRTVVEEGTGFSAAVDGYDVAAKTGTGEEAENGTYLKDKYLASLIGFAPASDPQVLVYVGLNETPYISYSSAGPVFSAIMGEVLENLGVLSN